MTTNPHGVGDQSAFAPQSEPTDSRLRRLIIELGSHDPGDRQKARDELVRIGDHHVTRELLPELDDPRTHVRWEAAKALAAIGDPAAAHGLMHSLDDEDQDVCWVAAEGLIALGRIGLLTVLSGISKRATSNRFCQSAHHVLRELRAQGYETIITPVLAALEGWQPGVAGPPAAYQALLQLKGIPVRVPLTELQA